MQKFLKLLIYCLIVFVFYGFYDMQDETIIKIINKINTYTSNYPQEKVFLHTDKHDYAQGEIIWFKAYLTDGSQHLPDTISEVLYVDLMDDNSKLIEHKIIKINNGFGKGDFLLSDSLFSGIYTLKAYTNWMRNFDTDFFFSQKISIFNKKDLTNYKTETQPLNNEIDIKFFPEGGNLVAGLTSKIAFKAVDKYGKGVNVKGEIFTQSGEKIADFVTIHNGMGFFHLQSKENEKYIAKIKLNDTAIREFSLPQINNEGYVMTINNDIDTRLFIDIKGKEGSTVYLLGISRGIVKYNETISLQNNTASININKESIPMGIFQLVLFNEEGIPQCERLVFNNNFTRLDIDIQPEQTEFYPHKKTTLNILTTNENGEPVSANFSLSITDLKQIAQGVYNDNICSYLYLSSDLKGRIENPSFYFTNKSAKARKWLDLVMLCNGWRRYDVNNILQNKPVNITFRNEYNLSVSGKVTKIKSKKGFTNNLVMSLSQKENQVEEMQYANINTDSTFIFNINDYTDTVQLSFLNLNKNGNSEEFIMELNKPSIPLYSKPIENLSSIIDTILKIKQQQEKENDKNIMQHYTLGMNDILLNTLNVSSQKKSPRPTTPTVLYQNPTYSFAINGKNPKGYRHPVEYALINVPGIKMENNEIYNTRPQTSMFYPKPIKFLLNGIFVDMHNLYSIEMTTVKTIEFIAAPAPIYGTDCVNGILSVITDYTAKNKDYEVLNMLKFNYIAFSKNREFAYPDCFKSEQSSIPDLRSVLYWNPEIITDKNGKATITFYNSDNLTKVRVEAQGISETGIPGTGEFIYEIKK